MVIDPEQTRSRATLSGISLIGHVEAMFAARRFAASLRARRLPPEPQAQLTFQTASPASGSDGIANVGFSKIDSLGARLARTGKLGARLIW